MNLRQQAAGIKSAMQSIVDGAKAEGRDLTDDEANDIEAKGTEYAALTERAEKAEKATRLVADLADAPTHDDAEAKGGAKATPGLSVSERFVKSDAFASFRKAHPRGVSTGTPIQIDAKGLGSVRDLGVGRKADLTTSTSEFGGAGREAGYRNNLPVDEGLTFLDLVTVGNTNVSFSEYEAVIAETNNAAVVAEGALKPLSDLTTDTFESRAFTYADGFVVTNQTLADDGALVAFMESRIRRHVRGVIEDKLVKGTGVGEPTGILAATGTLAQAFDTDRVTTIARAIEKFEGANDTGLQAIVMHPTDIWSLRLLKDGQGNYMLGNPLQQGLNPSPFGAPLVASRKVTVGSALVGRFDSMNYLELEPLNVLAFNQHENFAQLNKTYVRAESRGRQVFYAPREVVVADLTA